MVDGFAALKKFCCGLLITSLVVISAATRAADSWPVRIGVLTKGNEALTMQRWPATAEYLQNHIPAYKFEIVPLNLHQIDNAVKEQKIDFLLTNPTSFIEMESRYGVSAVLTLNRRLSNEKSTFEFAAVVLTRAGRIGLQQYPDLKGKSFAAVDKAAFGGWAMAWYQMKVYGINPFEDLQSISFVGSHEAVVQAVLDGKVDAGTVRTGVLERMAKAGQLDLDQLHILSNEDLAHMHDGDRELPLLHSTMYYPEWPLASLAHTNNDLVKQVVKAMLEMGYEDSAAQAARISGWIPPLNYLTVHNLMKDLHLAQYQYFGKVGLLEAARQHWYWVVLIVFSLSILLLFAWYAVRLSLRVGQVNDELKQEIDKKFLVQTELLAETEKANNILANMLEGVVTIDRIGLIQTFNQAAENIFGYQQSEVLGQNVRLLMPKVDALMHDQHLDNYVASKKSKIIGLGREVFGQRKDGESFPLEISVSEMVASGERMFIAVMRDLSDSKQAEQKIMRLVAAIQHAADGVFIANLDGCIEYVNPACEAITGYSQFELENQKLQLFEKAEQDESDFGDLFEILKMGNSWSGQYTARHKSGSMYEEAVTIAPVLDDKGKVNCFVGVCRDISEKLLHDQRLQQLEKFELVAKMAGGFAHDFNNLLSSIVGYTDMALLDMDKDSELAADMGRVLDAAGRAKLLVQQLQALSRRDYDEALVFMPQKTVHEVVVLLTSMLPAGVMMSASVQDDSCEIFLPPAQFQKIVMSLGLHVVDALGEEDGCIEISLRNETLTQQQVASKEGLVAGEYVVLKVSRDGEQIDAAKRADVFEDCYTTHDSVNAQSTGLAEIYGIVNHHKGCLEAVSGGGVSFSVYLPCAVQDETGY